MRFVSFALALVLLGCGDGDPPVLGGDGGRDASTDAGFDAEGFDASMDARRTDTAPPDRRGELWSVWNRDSLLHDQRYLGVRALW